MYKNRISDTTVLKPFLGQLVYLLKFNYNFSEKHVQNTHLLLYPTHLYIYIMFSVSDSRSYFVYLHYHLRFPEAGSLRVMCFCYRLSILLNFRFVFKSRSLTFKTKFVNSNVENKKFHSIVRTIFSTFYPWKHKTFLPIVSRVTRNALLLLWNRTYKTSVYKTKHLKKS